MSRPTVDLSARLDESTENGNPAEFPVTTRPVFYGDSYRVHRVPKRRAVVREDTGRPLAVVSDRYTLVEHGRLLESVEHAIEQLELDGVPRGIYVEREGARMRALYKFPQLARPVHREDPICPCVKLQNSYDRSLRAAVHIGAFRFVCTNLAVGGGGVFAGGFVTLHRGEIPVEKVTEQLAAYLDGFEEIARLYRHWAETRLDWERLTELLEPLAQHVQEGITEWVRPAFGATVYEAYNAATRYATHEMSSYQSAFRLLKQINRDFQNRFPVPSSNPSLPQARDGDVPGSFFGWLIFPAPPPVVPAGRPRYVEFCLHPREVPMRRRALLTFLFLALSAGPAPAQNSLTIHHLDVDQGDATLMVAPNGKTLLVDAGLDSRGDEVADFLKGSGINAVDAFVLTHYDADHYGGVDKMVAEGISVAAWYDRGEKAFLPEAKRRQEQFQEYVGAASAPVRLMPGDRIELDPTVSIVVVAANGHVRGAVGKYSIDDLDENGYSVALLISWNGFNYFVGGDLTREVEERIVREAALGDLDVYKVSHHGSATSSSDAFLQAIRPEVAAISNGSHGGFNHPRQAVLDTLRRVPGIEVYQTNRLQPEDLDNRGRVVGGNVPDGFIGDLDAVGAEGTVTVVARGEQYKVRLPARDIERIYSVER